MEGWDRVMIPEKSTLLCTMWHAMDLICNMQDTHDSFYNYIMACWVQEQSKEWVHKIWQGLPDTWMKATSMTTVIYERKWLGGREP